MIRKLSFNTASVLIQLSFQDPSFSIPRFQYSICSYSTCKYSKNYHSDRVSIQHLFLFNALPRHYHMQHKWFQYSICSYSTHGKPYPFRSIRLFQYSICSYSTLTEGSISPNFSRFNTASVLIQRTTRRKGI